MTPSENKTSFQIIGEKAKNKALTILNSFYQQDFIPAEKKPYLVAHANSRGPYMAIESEDENGKAVIQYILDASSQIATLGAGFNPSLFQAMGFFSCFWDGNLSNGIFKYAKQELEEFLAEQAHLSPKNAYFKYCHSGSEGNEIALGSAFARRRNPFANRVMAFQNSFHGRMLHALSTTWGKAKRLPFEYPEVAVDFLNAPCDALGILSRPVPPEWFTHWRSSGEFPHAPYENLKIQEELLGKEIEALLLVDKTLSEGRTFAMIVEPIQCEGGDNILSNRFISGLLALSKKWDVDLILDEVQSGFFLGQDFFWHTSFHLETTPDYIVCAKKSQVGIVISPHPFVWESQKNQEIFSEDFNPLSLLKGLFQAREMFQSRERLKEIESLTRQHLTKFVSLYKEHLENPRCIGLSFSVDLKNPELLDTLVAHRFDEGLLFYPAGEKTLRFRLNLCFTSQDLKILFQGLSNLCDKHLLKKEQTTTLAGSWQSSPSFKTSLSQEQEFPWFLLLTKAKFFKSVSWQEVCDLFKKTFPEYHLEILQKLPLEQSLPSIMELQKLCYEPARQTPQLLFERLLQNSKGASLGVFENVTGENSPCLLAMSHSGAVTLFPEEIGANEDCFWSDHTYYQLDTTTHPSIQGRGLGKILKYALEILVMEASYNATHLQGRNRDVYAKSMIHVNSSLGAIFYKKKKNDYEDSLSYRDVYVYFNKTKETLIPALDTAIEFPSLPLFWHKEGETQVLEEYLTLQRNKLCVSNFISHSYLKNLKTVANHLPTSLQHLYAASGQSECVDKIIKSFWFKAKQEQRRKLLLLSFQDQFMGMGSFCARSLSGFKSVISSLQLPSLSKRTKEALESLEDFLWNWKRTGDTALPVVFVEPLEQLSMEKISEETLRSILILCSSYKVPCVFNETASQLYRYTTQECFVSNLQGMTPTAGFAYLGGQMAIVFQTLEYYISKPITMISTWDGDEAGLFLYTHALKRWSSLSVEEKESLAANFIKKFSLILEPLKKNCRFTFSKRGVGKITGATPYDLKQNFSNQKKNLLICPSLEAIESFLQQ